MMKQKYLLLNLVILFGSSFANAAVLASAGQKSASRAQGDAQLLEELTGRKATAKASGAVSNAAPVVKQVPSKLHLNAGYQAYIKKDYILALKHYNTVLAKYPKSAEVRLTYMAKAKLYNEMGLVEPAERNYKLAERVASQTIQTK